CFASRACSASAGWARLSLQAHTVGDIAVIECSGRIVEGADAAALYQQVRDLLARHRFFVIDLRNVSFIDSAGLGMLVRVLSRVRGMAGDLKLCAAGANVEKTRSGCWCRARHLR